MLHSRFKEGRWAQDNFWLPFKGQVVFIKGGDEDVYNHIDYWSFDWKNDSYIHPSLRKKPKDAHDNHDDHNDHHNHDQHDKHHHGSHS